MAYTPEQRAEALGKVIEGLRKGTPLTVICAGQGMPDDDTVRDWAKADTDLSRAIARAREAGFDAIAIDALNIADDTSKDTVTGKDGQEMPNSEWITRSRLRVDTRLKLLSKWDPKRYGDSTMLKHADADGGPLDLPALLAERRQRASEGRNGDES